jgi:hypothetical protein
MEVANKKSGLLYVSFNQDYGCFACGTDKGFFICDSEPLKERFRRGNYKSYIFNRLYLFFLSELLFYLRIFRIIILSSLLSLSRIILAPC